MTSHTIETRSGHQFSYFNCKTAALTFLLLLGSFAHTIAATCNFSSGCLKVLADGTVVFKIDYTGTSSCPVQFIWVDNGGTTVGPFAPDIVLPAPTISGTHYYFLPPGTLTTPIEDCYLITHDGNPGISTPTPNRQVCLCEEGDCDASFTLNLFSNIPDGASISPNNTADHFLFDYGDGNGQGWDIGFSNIYGAAGSYKVCYTLITPDGHVCKECMMICIDSVDIDTSQRMFRTIGKNGKSALTNMALSDVKVFPNPTSSGATLSFNLRNESKVKISVHDLTGRKIMNVPGQTTLAGANRIEINTDHLSPGNYIVMLQEGKHTYSVKLIVVK